MVPTISIKRGQNIEMIITCGSGVELDTPMCLFEDLSGPDIDKIIIRENGNNVLPSTIGLNSSFDVLFSGNPLEALAVSLATAKSLCDAFEGA